MPTVPIPAGPQVQAGGLRTFNTSQADVSSGARDMAGAIDNLGELAFKAASRQSAIKAFELDSRVREEWAAKDTELRQKYSGENSGQYVAETQRWWDEAPGRVTDEVPALGRESLGRSLGSARAQALAGAAGFHATEQEKALDQRFNGAMAATQQTYMNDLSAYNAKERGVAADKDFSDKITAYGRLRGMPQEAIDAATAKYTGAFHADAVRRLMNSDLATAKAYLADYKGKIDSDSYTVLEKALQETTDGAAAMSAVDGVIQSFGGLRDGKPIEKDKMEAKLREQFGKDPKQLEAARSELNIRIAAHRDAEKERDGEKIASVMDAFTQGASLARLKTMPDYQMLSGTDRANVDQRILSFTEARANAGEAGYRRAQAQLERRGFEAIEQYSDPAALAAVSRGDIAKLRPNIGDDATMRLLKNWDQVNKAAKEGKASLAQVTIDNDMFKTVVENMGLDPLTKSKDVKAQIGRVRTAMEDAIASAQEAKGSALSYKEKRDLAEKVGAVTVRQKGWFTDTDIPAAAVGPGVKIVVPAGVRADLLLNMQEQFQATGDKRFAPTEDNIQRYYAEQRLRAARN